MSAVAAAELLGVHASTARRWIEGGHIGGMRIGRRWWTTVRALERFRELVESGGGT